MQKENGIWGMLTKFLEVIAPVVIISLVTWCAWATKELNNIEIRLASIDQWRSSRPDFVTGPELQASMLKSIQDIDNAAGVRLDQIHVQLRDLQKEVTTFTVLLTEHMRQQSVKP